MLKEHKKRRMKVFYVKLGLFGNDVKPAMRGVRTHIVILENYFKTDLLNKVEDILKLPKVGKPLIFEFLGNPFIANAILDRQCYSGVRL